MSSVRGNTSRRNRRGVAAAELAVCLPVIVMLVMATIEACSALFLKQSLTAAAYEGVRTALEESATTKNRPDGLRSDPGRSQDSRARKCPSSRRTSRPSSPEISST